MAKLEGQQPAGASLLAEVSRRGPGKRPEAVVVPRDSAGSSWICRRAWRSRCGGCPAGTRYTMDGPMFRNYSD